MHLAALYYVLETSTVRSYTNTRTYTRSHSLSRSHTHSLSLTHIGPDDLIIVGKDGLLLAGPNALILEPLVLYYVSLLSREVFIRNYFMRVFVLVDTLTKIRQLILRYAIYCNTLRHAATRCNTLQRTATQCSKLQHTAILRYARYCNNALQQYATTHCNILDQHFLPEVRYVLQPYAATHCNNMLQHTATYWISTHLHKSSRCVLGPALQHNAKYCNTLQLYTATHCNTEMQHHTATTLSFTNSAAMHRAPHCNTLQYTATHCNSTL